jgi:hypothetical protein
VSTYDMGNPFCRKSLSGSSRYFRVSRSETS